MCRCSAACIRRLGELFRTPTPGTQSFAWGYQNAARIRRLVELWDFASPVCEVEPYDLVAAVEKVCRIPKEDFCGPGKSAPAIMEKRNADPGWVTFGCEYEGAVGNYWDQFVSTKSTARRSSTVSARQRIRQ